MSPQHRAAGPPEALDALLEGLDEAAFILVQGRVARCNASAAALLGALTPDSLQGRRLVDLVDPERAPALDDALSDLERDLRPHTLQPMRLGPREVEVRLQPCTWRAQRAQIVICRDATPLRRTREKLAESLLRVDVLERVANQAQLDEVLFAIMDFVDRTHADLFTGVWVRDSPGLPFASLLAAPGMPEFMRLACQHVDMSVDTGPVASCLHNGVRVLVRDPNAISTDPLRLQLFHEWGVCALWCEPILGAEDHVLGAVVVYYREPRLPEPWDLDFIRSAVHLAAIAIERRRAEEALRLSEARFRTLFDHALEAIFVIDLDAGKIVNCNPRAERLLALDREAILGLSPLDISPAYQPDGARSRDIIRSVDDLLRSGEPVERAWVIRDGYGRERPCAVSSVLLPEPGRTLVRTTLTDLSAQRRAETERAALEVELRHTQRLSALGTLAGAVAHEINNPIQGIMGYAELIGLRAAHDPAVSRYAAEIIHESERTAAIVRSLLAFARREQDQPLHPLEINSVVRSTLPLLQTLLGRDNIALEVQHHPLPLYALGRSAQLRQILLNLATNARDAINARAEPDAPRRLQITTGFEHDEPSGRPGVWLAVEDSGVGIPQDALAHIFDPFFTTKPAEQGTGMGLPISASIAAEHGGRLSVESTPGRGARFCLHLPAVDDPARDVG